MERYKDAKIASIVGISGNIFLLIIKSIIGFLTNSQAMISDALNSAGDIVSSVMTFIGNRISSKEADDDHNLGHGKAEYIFSLLISIIMVYFSVKMIISSVKSLFCEQSYHFSIGLLHVCFITIVVKFCMYLYTIKLAKKYNNLLLNANASDHRNDCVLTTMNLLAAIFAMNKVYFVDSIVGILVSSWIFFVGAKLFKNAYDVLMDKSMDENLRKKIEDIIDNCESVKKMNHFNSTPIGYQYQISVTIFVDGNLTTFESHEIANQLEKQISALDEVYLTVIHVNPL